MQLGPSLRRAGNGVVNTYLVEESGEVTVIDAGLPGLWDDLVAELAAMGRSAADVRALILTNGHSDHIGFAERARRERGIPIEVHELDAALARGEAPNPAQGFGRIRVRPLVSFLAYGIRNGYLRTPKIAEVVTFGDGATLDLPGSPRVVHVPGHTAGSAALHVPSVDALFVGDALATYAVTDGYRGPQLAPFTADRSAALQSLDRIAPLDAAWVLPGDGEPWTAGAAEAVRLVREREAATAKA